MRLEEEESVVSAPRFFVGSLTCALHAVCRDFAALGSFKAVDTVLRSAAAMSAMLGGKMSRFVGYIWGSQLPA